MADFSEFYKAVAAQGIPKSVPPKIKHEPATVPVQHEPEYYQRPVSYQQSSFLRESAPSPSTVPSTGTTPTLIFDPNFQTITTRKKSKTGEVVITKYPPPMAGTPQYNFPPPPPAPPQQYGYAQQQQPPQYQQQQRGGGGGATRGIRGGGLGRADFHTPYNPHQPNAGYDPQRPQGPPQQQGGYQGPNGQQVAPYIGPQIPQSQGQQGVGGYSAAPQWQNNQQHSQQHGPPHHGPQQHQPPIQHGPPQVAPLSAQNYHPNYAPQAYQPQQPQQPQYGPQQPPQFQPTHTPNYGHSVTPHQPPQVQSPQWQGPPQTQHARPPFNNNRGRGGFTGGRGGHEQAPLMGPPIRMGFDNDRGGHSQAGSGFPQQYSSHQSPPAPFSQPHYQGYPPQQEYHGGQRPSLDPNPFNSPQRGRGGGGGGNNSNFRGGRDRGNNHSNHNQHSRDGRGRQDRQDHRQGNRASSENHHNKSAGADANGKKKKKRRTNTLGLTPNGVDHEDSEEEIDDVDEEARLVTLLGPDTPQLPTDLEAWLAERKSKFPTKARRDAAAAELRQRREQGRNGKHGKENGIKKEAETPLEKEQRKLDKLRLELAKAERKIQQEMSGGKRKRENGDIGDEDQVSNDSNGSSDSESDSKPEAFSSRTHNPMRVQQPAKSQLQRHCKYFSTGGTCGKKGKCRFVHDQEVRNQALRDKEANGGKMTLAQRLILNDTAKDDLTILKSIKYLKEKGLMPDQLTAGNTSRYDDDGREENGYTENLNYGDN